MAGLKFQDDSMGPKMSYYLAHHGVLAIYTGNEPSVMRLMPSLVIQEEDVNYLASGLERAIESMVKGESFEQDVAPITRRRPVKSTQQVTKE